MTYIKKVIMFVFADGLSQVLLVSLQNSFAAILAIPQAILKKDLFYELTSQRLSKGWTSVSS